MQAVILDQAHWTQLEQVQIAVEHTVTYQSDMERFGVPDWWEPAVDKGDCEDIVLTKRKRLMELGWPADALRIAVVIDGHGALHAVLTVDVVTQKGARATYVLDSHFTHVEPWNVLGQYGYTWLERSKPGSSQWSRLDNGTPAETLRIASLASAVMPASPRWGDTQPVRLSQDAQVPVTVTALKAVLPVDPEVGGARIERAVLDSDEGPALVVDASLENDSTADAADGRRHHHGARHHARAHAHARHGRRTA